MLGEGDDIDDNCLYVRVVEPLWAGWDKLPEPDQVAFAPFVAVQVYGRIPADVQPTAGL